MNNENTFEFLSWQFDAEFSVACRMSNAWEFKELDILEALVKTRVILNMTRMLRPYHSRHYLSYSNGLQTKWKTAKASLLGEYIDRRQASYAEIFDLGEKFEDLQFISKAEHTQQLRKTNIPDRTAEAENGTSPKWSFNQQHCICL